jgi:hypothetical protein
MSQLVVVLCDGEFDSSKSFPTSSEARGFIYGIEYDRSSMLGAVLWPQQSELLRDDYGDHTYTDCVTEMGEP